MKTLNIGIVGTGSASSMHFDVLKQLLGVLPRAVCGRDEVRLSLKQLEWGISAYSSVVEMVQNEKLDILLIANENFNHAADACLAIKAGAHVLVEKPLDGSLSSAKELLTFAKLHNKI